MRAAQPRTPFGTGDLPDLAGVLRLGHLSPWEAGGFEVAWRNDGRRSLINPAAEDYRAVVAKALSFEEQRITLFDATVALLAQRSDFSFGPMIIILM
jgi:hypothetical protein